MCRVVACMGECTQIFCILFGGLSGRVSSRRVWVSVRRFFGFVFGGNKFLQCNDAKVLFCVCCCFASQSKRCDVINATMKNTA